MYHHVQLRILVYIYSPESCSRKAFCTAILSPAIACRRIKHDPSGRTGTSRILSPKKVQTIHSPKSKPPSFFTHYLSSLHSHSLTLLSLKFSPSHPFPKTLVSHLPDQATQFSRLLNCSPSPTTPKQRLEQATRSNPPHNQDGGIWSWCGEAGRLSAMMPCCMATHAQSAFIPTLCASAIR